MIFPCGMSRSGTTLLTTLFDSHPQVSMGYELIPPQLPGPMYIYDQLEKGLELANGDYEKTGNVLKKNGVGDAGVFITRCYRAGVEVDALRTALKELHHEGMNEIKSLRDRLKVAWKIAKIKADDKNTPYYGFKLNIPSVKSTKNYFPNAHYVYILRDPRDVVSSHFERGFKRTVNEICDAWNNYLEQFEKFHDKNPSISAIIRYEDLVSDSVTSIHNIFEVLPVSVDEQIFTFYKSKASVHQTGHPNAENLKKNFFTTSINRWKNSIQTEDLDMIIKKCGSNMTKYKYDF